MLSDPMPRIWVPVAGRGPADGFRYRDTFAVLDVPEIRQADELALTAVSRFADGADGDLGEWTGHGAALSVYVMWAVLALEARRAIDVEESKDRFKRLADLQRTVHRGRSSGWLAPSWWGSAVHGQHQELLIAIDPGRYSSSVFARGSFLDTPAVNSGPFGVGRNVTSH
jgi:hypothetical protein